MGKNGVCGLGFEGREAVSTSVALQHGVLFLLGVLQQLRGQLREWDNTLLLRTNLYDLCELCYDQSHCLRC